MSTKSVDFRYISQKLQKSFNIFDYRLNEIYVEYLKNYHSNSNFIDKSFIINKNDSLLYCPLTIEIRNNDKILDFYGDPFFVICHNPNKELASLFYFRLKEICSQMNIKKINLVLQRKDFLEYFKNDREKALTNKICYRRYIDLTLNTREIYAGFSRGLKNKINKNFNSLKYTLIDFKNYHENYMDILHMMNLHKEVSKKSTRSEKTWLLNGEMIKNNNGLLVKTSLNEKAISYFFVIYTQTEAYYFTSCTYRSYFKEFTNITHKSIFHVINYLKKIGCKTFTLGDSNTIYSSNLETEKEKNIHKFKNSFGGNKFINYYFNNLDQSLLKVI